MHVKKHFFWHQNVFMQVFNEYILCRQNIDFFGTSCGLIPRVYTIYTRHTKLIS